MSLNIFKNLLTNPFWMEEIAQSISITFSFNVLLALRVREISHWGEFCHQLNCIVVAVLKCHHALKRITLSIVLHVDITFQVIYCIIANNKLLNFTILWEFQEHILIELFISIQCFLGFYLTDDFVAIC